MKKITQACRDILTEKGVATIYPVPIQRICKRLGYRVKGFNEEDMCAGLECALHYEKKLIIVNACLDIKRQRYLASYCLGHSMLFPGENLPLKKNHFPFIEDDCSLFSAEILLPPCEFLKVFRNMGGWKDIDKISSYFMVPPYLIKFRIDYFLDKITG